MFVIVISLRLIDIINKPWHLLQRFGWNFPAKICWSSRRLDDVFKTCLQGVFNTSSAQKLEGEKLLRWKRLEDVLKTCLEDVLKTSWSQTKCLLGISVSNHSLLTNLNQYLRNLYLTIIYFTNLRRTQHALIRTQ